MKPYIFISHHRSYSCSMVIIYFIAQFASGSPFWWLQGSLDLLASFIYWFEDFFAFWHYLMLTNNYFFSFLCFIVLIIKGLLVPASWAHFLQPGFTHWVVSWFAAVGTICLVFLTESERTCNSSIPVFVVISVFVLFKCKCLLKFLILIC